MFLKSKKEIAICYIFFHLFANCTCTDLYSDDVRNYDQETFMQNIGKGIPHFINFFAPWCGYCKRLKPVWDELAEKYNAYSPNQKLVIAKVDCTTETPLCADEGVTGYPSLIFYDADDKEGKKYKGKRDLLGLEEFIATNVDESKEKKSIPPIQENEAHDTASHVVELTDDNFHDTIAWGLHFVKFYAPWCGHCQKLVPLWEELAESSSLDKSLTISKIDCTVNKRSCSEFGIKEYPTLLWIVDGKKVDKYQGPRDIKGLKQFITEKKLIQKELVESEYEKIPDANAKTDLVVTLTEHNFDNAIARDVSFVMFYAPWCGHSRRLEPVWKNLAQKFAANTNVKVAKVDCSQNEEFCKTYKVVGYPSLLLFHSGKYVSEYRGIRKLENLHSFVHDNLHHDEL